MSKTPVIIVLSRIGTKPTHTGPTDAATVVGIVKERDIPLFLENLLSSGVPLRHFFETMQIWPEEAMALFPGAIELASEPDDPKDLRCHQKWRDLDFRLISLPHTIGAMQWLADRTGLPVKLYTFTTKQLPKLAMEVWVSAGV